MFGKTLKGAASLVGLAVAVCLTLLAGAFVPGVEALAQTAVKTPQIRFCAPAKFRLVLDVGHTPEVPGAISARGVGEYEFNWRLANEAYEALRRAGFSRTYLINARQREMSLGERVSEARRRKADLLVSIHHDSVLPQFLKNGKIEGVEREFTTYARGYSIFVSEGRSTSAKSLAAARLLGNALQAQGLVGSTHNGEPIKGANRKRLDAHANVYAYPALVVLKYAKMPSLLFEGGVIKNPADETRMNNPEHRAKLVNAIVSMAQSYCG